jgi:tetratricopeptide (TPR) repeat protein
MNRKSLLGVAVITLLVAGSPANAGWEEGVAAFNAGKYDAASAEFLLVIDQSPDWPGGYLMLGRTLLKMNRPSEAVTQLRKAYDLNPNDNSAKLALAQAYLEAKRYGDAASLLKTVDESGLNAAQKKVYHQMTAKALDKSGQGGAAVAALKKAADAAPNDAEAQYVYGVQALADGQTDAAIAALEKAVRLDSKDAKKRKSLAQALLRKGRESSKSQKAAVYAKAVAAASALASASPTYDNYLLLGEAQLGAKAYGDAVQSFQTASGKNANAWLPHFYIGQAHTATTSYVAAEGSLNKALGLVKASADRRRIQKQLAFVYEKEKKYTEAENLYKQAGDQAGAARVAENARIHQENVAAEEHNKMIEELEAEAKALEEQMKELPGGGPPN